MELMMKQALNPYLPSFEYIPDGEPHLFGDRIYLYGSHDRFDGAAFCLNDYVCYSASVDDLTDWRYEGVIYRKEQDVRNQNIPEDAPEQKPVFGIKPKKPGDLNPRGIHAMWAPDVVRGKDGKYYLYYCLDYLPEIGVAVSDSPAGKYEFLGLVRHADGTPLGSREGDLIQFDPGIFIDDDGTIYLYSGNAPMRLQDVNDRKGSQVMTLEEDMLTLRTEPKKLMPDLRDPAGSGFEGHEFFEASSIRKINGKYYFVYSSVQSHELCYAVSDRPDEGYVFGGTLVDIGDVFLNGLTEAQAVNHLGNTHGGIERAGERWFVFYHRQTNRTNFSRQACAEEIFFDENGRISQAEVTSCGLNGKPLRGSGTYAARICCELIGKQGAAFSHPDVMKMDYPYLTQDEDDLEPTEENRARDAEDPVQFIRNIRDGSVAGYKYFLFEVKEDGNENAFSKISRVQEISFRVRGEAEGQIEVYTSPMHYAGSARVSLSPGNGNSWTEISGAVRIPAGRSALYFVYRGSGWIDMKSFTLKEQQ